MKILGVSPSALALEFVVVVAGVLIALGVDQAVDDARERRLERAYLSALMEDVASDTLQLRTDFLPHLDEREEMAREIVSVVEGGPVTDVRQLAVALDWAGHLRVFEPQRATFEDLLATGNLRLLEDRELRARVIAYYDLTQLSAMHDLIRQEIWYGYRAQIDQVLDPLVMVELTRIEREVDRDPGRLAEGLDSDVVAASLDLPALRSSRDFREGIGASLEYTLVQRDTYRTRMSLAEDLLLALNEALAGD